MRQKTRDLVNGVDDAMYLVRDWVIVPLLAALPVMVLIIGYIGCSLQLNNGEVIDKTYTPAKTWVQIVKVEQTRVIAGKLFIPEYLETPMLHNHPDIYGVTIKGTNWIGTEKETVIYVAKETYNTLKFGDHYVVQDGDSRIKPIVEKRVATDEEQQEYGVLPIADNNTN